MLLCYSWNRLQNWNSKICRVIRDWKIVLDRIGSARLVEIFKSRLLKQLPLIIVWLWRIPLGWTTLNCCSLDQFLILLPIRRTSYHLLREDDLNLSTSFNISSLKILLTLFSEIVKFYGNCILLECRNLYVLLIKL